MSKSAFDIIDKLNVLLLKNDFTLFVDQGFLCLLESLSQEIDQNILKIRSNLFKFLQASLYRIAKILELLIKKDSKVNVIDLKLLLKIYAVLLTFLDTKYVFIGSSAILIPAESFLVCKEFCRFLINITEFLFDITEPILHTHLIRSSIICSCRYIYVILDRKFNPDSSLGTSSLLSLICGIKTTESFDPTLYQYIVSTQIQLLRLFFLTLNIEDTKNEITENCIQLSNCPGGLLFIIKRWHTTDQIAPLPYIRNVVKIYQKLALFVSNPKCKIQILDISVKFLEMSELTVDKQLDYFLIVINELKEPCTDDALFSRIIQHVVNFFELKLIPYKNALNWRWLYLFEFLVCASFDKKVAFFSLLYNNSAFGLISLLPTSSQIIFKIYLQFILLATSEYTPSLFFADFDSSTAFDNSTLYLLSKLFSFFSTINPKCIPNSINYITTSFLELKLHFRDNSLFSQHSHTFMKGLLIMTESLYTLLENKTGINPSTHNLKCVLKQLNEFYYFMNSDDRMSSFGESYCKRLLSILSRLYPAGHGDSFVVFFLDIIYQSEFLLKKIQNNQEIIRSLSYCLLEDLKITNDHFSFSMNTLLLIKDEKIIEKLFFHASSIPCVLKENNKTISIDLLKNFFIAVRAFLSKNISRSSKQYLKKFLEFCLSNLKYFADFKFPVCIILSYLLVTIECSSPVFVDSSQHNLYIKCSSCLWDQSQENLKSSSFECLFHAFLAFSLFTVLIRLKKERSSLTNVSCEQYRTSYLALVQRFKDRDRDLSITYLLPFLFSTLTRDLLELMLASFRLEGDHELALIAIYYLKGDLTDYPIFHPEPKSVSTYSLHSSIQLVDNSYPLSDKVEYFFTVESSPARSSSYETLASLLHILSASSSNSSLLQEETDENGHTSKILKLAYQWHRLSAFLSLTYKISHLYFFLGDFKSALYFSATGISKESSFDLEIVDFYTENGGYLISQREMEFLFLIYKLDLISFKNEFSSTPSHKRMINPNFISAKCISKLKNLYDLYSCLSWRRKFLIDQIYKFSASYLNCTLSLIADNISNLCPKLAYLLQVREFVFGSSFSNFALKQSFEENNEGLTCTNDVCVMTIAMLKSYLQENITNLIPFSIEKVILAFDSSDSILVRDASKYVFQYPFNLFRLSNYYIGLGTERSFSLINSLFISKSKLASTIEDTTTPSYDKTISILSVKIINESEFLLSFYDKIDCNMDFAAPSISLHRKTTDSLGDENVFNEHMSPSFTFDNLRHEWISLIKKNRDTAAGYPSTSNNEDLGVSSSFWWSARQKLDTAFSCWLSDFSVLVFGIFPFLLQLDHNFEDSEILVMDLKSALANIGIFLLDDQFLVLCRILFSIDFTKNSNYLSYLIMEFYKHFALSSNNIEALLSTLGEFLQNKIFKTSKKSSQFYFILLLDEVLLEYPFESVPFLSQYPVVRMPSMSSIVRSLKEQRKREYKSVSYLLNPDATLKSTQDRLMPFLTKDSTWKGIIGREPTALEQEEITNSDIFLYFGHGNGEKYCRNISKDIKASKEVKVPSIVVLMGCSSAAISKYGLFEPTSTPMDYLLAGSQVVIGNLWDVTDKDIDRFALTTLAGWGLLDITGVSSLENKMNLAYAASKARSCCILRYAVGAAPVVWGMPALLKL